LINGIGQDVVLHGVDRMGTEYVCVQRPGIFDGPSDQASITAIKSWRTNAVRVPLNEDCWLGINGVPAAYGGAAYQQAIKNYVNLLNQNGLYVILDLHWAAPGTTKATGQLPMPNMDHSPTFWSQVATAFKGNNAVLFDLYNEPIPNGNTDTTAAWKCWRDGSAGGTCTGLAYQAAGMQALLDAVRATGASNVVMVGGVQWANTLWTNSADNWLTYKPADPLNNLAASIHFYNWTWCMTVTCYNGEVAPVAAQVPVVAGELGNNSCDATWWNTIMSWLDGKQIGYLAWVWNTTGTNCSDIKLILDYTGTPSAYGLVYKTHLAGLP
jgi:hypothetical protein